MRAAALATVVGTAASTAYADPLAVSDALVFMTEDQSMWSPGQGDLVNKPFHVTLVNIDTGFSTLGEIFDLSTTIPNPAYLAWKVAYDACRVAFSDNVCRNGATIPLVGHVGGLGNPPAQTLTVDLGKNGLEVSYDVDIEAGVKGAFAIDGGKVDVTYPTTATLQADKSAYAPGDMVTLSFLEAPGIPTMATEFSDIDFSLSAWADIDAQAALEVYVANQGGVLELFDVDGIWERELFGTTLGQGEVELRLLGLDPIIVDTSGGLNIKTFNVKYPPAPPDGDGGGGPFGISLADFQLQIPDLDTPPNSTWNPSTGQLTNTQLPIEREIDDDDLTLIGSGTGFHRTDFAKADIDVDGILGATQGVILGLSTGIPFVINVEGNLLDLDLGAFFGVGQTMTFEPTLDVMLSFSEPITIQHDGQVFENVLTHWMNVGDSLAFAHPGGDFTVTPLYSLDNTFTNLTNLMISPVATLQALQLKLSGLAASLAGAAFDAALVHHVFPLFGPIEGPQLGNTEPFKMQGFDQIQGSSLVLSAVPETVPEPAMLLLLALGLGATAQARRRWRKS
jgi:hypothetical protein